MQLENYERSMLANKEEEEEQDLLIPIFNGHEINMSTEQNDRSPSLQGGIENNSERVEHNHGAMTHGQRGNRISVNTRLRRRQQHRLRTNRSNSLRRNIHRNNNQTAIPIRVYNSLRILVPSVASNRNASKLTVVDEAVRYIRELETTLANKVNSEGGLLLPEVERLEQTTPLQFAPSRGSKNNSYHITVNDTSIDLRSIMSEIMFTSEKRYVHDCTDILNGLHKTSISDTNVDRE